MRLLQMSGEDENGEHKMGRQNIPSSADAAITDTLYLKGGTTFAKNKIENKYDCYLAEDLLS